MNVEIRDEELIKAIEALAEEQGKDINETAEELLTFAVNNGLSVLLLKRLEYAIVEEIIPKIDTALVNTYAIRHQVLNMHADILQSPERAEAINQAAGEIGQEIVFANEEDEEEENGN